MDATIDIGPVAIVTLAVGALLLGFLMQLIGEVRSGYEWVVTAAAAFAGGFVASEWIVAFRDVEPAWERMAVVPAVGGAIALGVVVDAIVRYRTHGSYIHHVAAH
jgi:uncharacterized membrane protein YeaQ/YmgE (transglycosylase-associated protein family)